MEDQAVVSFTELLPWVSLASTFLLGFLMWRASKGANKNSEKKLTLEEQIAEDERGDKIAERRRVELERLYKRIETLEANDEAKTKQIESLEADIKVIRAEKEEIITHLLVLEQGYPNPPGPPPRPWLAPRPAT